MNQTSVGSGWLRWLVFLAVVSEPAGLYAQDAVAPAPLPLTMQTDASLPATDSTPALGILTPEQREAQINTLVQQLEQRSRVLDARQATLQEQERLLAERASVQEERELQLREREQAVAEREQVLATQVPLAAPEANVGVAAPGIESPPGTPTPRPDFQEPDLFNPGLDNQSFQPGIPNDFSAGPQDTRNNFISP